MAQSKFENLWRLMTKNKFEIEGETQSGVICALCSKLMIEPYAAECGCQFCGVCIKEYLRNGDTKCPVSNDGCSDITLTIDINVCKDVRANNIVKKVCVKCPNDRCTFSTELDKMEEHIDSCSMKPIECPFHSIGCEKVLILEDGIDEHILSDISPHSLMLVGIIDEMRMEINQLRELIESKDGEIQCLKEEAVTNKEEMENFREESRKTEVLMGEMNEKINGILGKMMSQGQTWNTCNNLTTEGNSNNELKIELERNKKDIEELREDSRRKEVLIKEMKEEIVVINDKLLSLRPKESKKENENAILNEPECGGDVSLLVKSEDAIMDKDCLKHDNEMKMNTNSNNKAEKNQSLIVPETPHYPKPGFVWELKDFSKKMVEGSKSSSSNGIFYSDPFSKDNYKCCLCARITELRDKFYLELYLVIMRGDRDEEAGWPMRHTLELSIINQSSMVPHKVGKYSHGTHKGHTYHFNKPMKATNDGIGGLSIAIKDITNTPGLLLKDTVMVTCSLHPVSR